MTDQNTNPRKCAACGLNAVFAGACTSCGQPTPSAKDEPFTVEEWVAAFLANHDVGGAARVESVRGWMILAFQSGRAFEHAHGQRMGHAPCADCEKHVEFIRRLEKDYAAKYAEVRAAHGKHSDATLSAAHQAGIKVGRQEAELDLARTRPGHTLCTHVADVQPTSEKLDAIRNAIAEASDPSYGYKVGTDSWWDAVTKAIWR